jgi:hypothetical protein
MSDDDLKELANDIKANGLKHPIAVTSVLDADGGIVSYRNKLGRRRETWILDGCNRLDAIELAGFDPIDPEAGTLKAGLGLPGELIPPDEQTCFINVPAGADKQAYVAAANIHRRHLTAELKRDLIAKLLIDNPEKSNRQIAEQLNDDHKKVGRVREALESTGALPQLEKTVGKDGKARKAKATPVVDDGEDDDIDDVVTGVTIEDFPLAPDPDGPRSWRVEAKDDAGGTWSNGVRLATKEEAALYLGNPVWVLRNDATLIELRVVPSEDEANVSSDYNQNGQLNGRVRFQHGQCYLLGWGRNPELSEQQSQDRAAANALAAKIRRREHREALKRGAAIVAMERMEAEAPESTASDDAVPEKPKRGRPKGSKNKPKIEAACADEGAPLRSGGAA